VSRTADGFARDIQRYLADEPVEACPPSSAYKLRKFARKNRKALATAGAFVLLLVAGMAVSVWQAVEANAARKLAGERLENETQARHEAEAHFQKALSAVKQMLFEVGDERVAAIPQMKETRQRLLDDAIAFYTDLIASNPRHSQVYYERGYLYWTMEKWEQARDDFQKALACDPDNAEVLAALGALLGEMQVFGGRFGAMGEKGEIVLPYLRRAMELQPTNPMSYVWLASSYEKLGRRKEVAAAQRKAAELFPPGSAEAHLYLGQACQTVGDPRTAREHFEKCLSIAPSEYYTHSEAHIGLGQVHSTLGEYDQALAAFNKALDTSRISSESLFHIYDGRGHIYILQKNYASALSDFNRALELRRSAWFIYKQRGLAHFRLQHYGQALADIAKAVEQRRGGDRGHGPAGTADPQCGAGSRCDPGGSVAGGVADRGGDRGQGLRQRRGGGDD
jgi:tetratricopeptide (TPR) repeat protein